MAKRTINLPLKQRYLNLAIQDSVIHRHFPDFQGRISRGRATWIGHLQPRQTSPVYRIEVSYKLKDLPRVWVLLPTLVRDAPHLFKDNSLCLYWWREWKWKPDRLIAETIIPWTASWLYHYELWLDTGHWLGPSSHKNITAKNEGQLPFLERSDNNLKAR